MPRYNQGAEFPDTKGLGEISMGSPQTWVQNAGEVGTVAFFIESSHRHLRTLTAKMLCPYTGKAMWYVPIDHNSVIYMVQLWMFYL